MKRAALVVQAERLCPPMVAARNASPLAVP